MICQICASVTLCGCKQGQKLSHLAPFLCSATERSASAFMHSTPANSTECSQAQWQQFPIFKRSEKQKPFVNTSAMVLFEVIAFFSFHFSPLYKETDIETIPVNNFILTLEFKRLSYYLKKGNLTAFHSRLQALQSA